jgi:enoyl-CoA hydratase
VDQAVIREQALDGGIRHLILDRPPLNAFDPDQLEALLAALAGPAPRGLVISGANGAFSAGVDVKRMPSLGPDGVRQVVLGLNRLVAVLIAMPCPVVAAVTGHAIGAGLILALCADWRLGADGPGKLGLPEISAGLPYPDGPYAVVEAELAEPHRRRLVMGGASISMAQGVDVGVLDALLPAHDLIDAAAERARELGRFPAWAPVKAQARASLRAKLDAIAARPSDPVLDRLGLSA